MAISHPGPTTDRSRILLRALVVCLVGTGILVATGLGLTRMLTDAPMLELLGRVEYGWLLLSTLLVLAGTASHGPRMRPLLPDPAPPARLPGRMGLGSLYVAASLLNLSFPGPAGELGAALVLRRTHGIEPASVVAASLHARFVSLLVAGLITLGCLPLLDLPPTMRLWGLGGSGLLGLGALVLGLLSFQPGWLRQLSGSTVGALGRWLPGLAGRLFLEVDRQVLGFAEALAAVPRRGISAYVQAAGWSLVSLLLSFGAILCAAAAFGISPDWLGTFVTLCLTLIAAVALVLLPGGLGTFDLVLTGMLIASAGLSAAEAGLVLLAVRLAQVLSMGIAALALLGWGGQLLRGEVIMAMQRGRLAPGGAPPTAGAVESAR